MINVEREFVNLFILLFVTQASYRVILFQSIDIF